MRQCTPARKEKRSSGREEREETKENKAYEIPGALHSALADATCMWSHAAPTHPPPRKPRALRPSCSLAFARAACSGSRAAAQISPPPAVAASTVHSISQPFSTLKSTRDIGSNTGRPSYLSACSAPRSLSAATPHTRWLVSAMPYDEISATKSARGTGDRKRTEPAKLIPTFSCKYALTYSTVWP